jgi:hypothetical protein
MAEALDRTRLAKIAAMLDSEFDGVCLNAARAASAMLKAAHVTWSDVLKEDQLAVEACKDLLGQLEAAQAKIADLERQLPDWQPVSKVTINNHNRSARWLLDLNAEGQVWLAAREREFVSHVAGWIGPLRPKMREWFQAILDRTAQRTGLAPP